VSRKRLGEILREKGSITDEQLEEALRRQQPARDDSILGRILFDMGLVAQDEVRKALAEQLWSDQVDLEDREIPKELIEALPVEFVREHRILLLEMDDEFATIVTSNPFNATVSREIGERLHRRVRIVLAAPAQISAAIAKYYGLATRDDSAPKRWYCTVRPSRFRILD